jgi:hypothetical protein
LTTCEDRRKAPTETDGMCARFGSGSWACRTKLTSLDAELQPLRTSLAASGLLTSAASAANGRHVYTLRIRTLTRKVTLKKVGFARAP